MKSDWSNKQLFDYCLAIVQKYNNLITEVPDFQNLAERKINRQGDLSIVIRERGGAVDGLDRGGVEQGVAGRPCKFDRFDGAVGGDLK